MRRIHFAVILALTVLDASVVAWIPSRRLGGRSTHCHVPAVSFARPTTTQRPLSSNAATDFPRLSARNLKDLREQKYVVIPKFLPGSLQQELRDDVRHLRSSGKFNIARIGQDATNTLNTEIRVAETCFLGAAKLADVPSVSRRELYKVLDAVRADLAAANDQPLDEHLTELLYAYYPRGGFYKRHRDAITGSASVLRKYSLLLYLNQDWVTSRDKGELRMHFDSGGDVLPEGEDPNYRDVEPLGGTLVLFESDAIPHEVRDTEKERLAVVGWYNRPVSVSDMAELSSGGETNVLLLGVAAALVTVGVFSILS